MCIGHQEICIDAYHYFVIFTVGCRIKDHYFRVLTTNIFGGFRWLQYTKKIRLVVEVDSKIFPSKLLRGSSVIAIIISCYYHRALLSLTMICK